MNEPALDTMARADKGAVAPPPALDGPLGIVADAIIAWAGITATAHWDLYRPSRLDGIDFYLGKQELGHIHLDGSIHLATNPSLGAALVAEGLARPFRYGRGWVCGQVHAIGTDAAIALFARNYERLAAAS